MFRLIQVIFILLVFLCGLQGAVFAEVVPFKGNANALILFSNEWTAYTHGYVNEPYYNNSRDYYGYFDPNKYYEYQKNAGFAPVGATSNHYVPQVETMAGDFWSGNFLNWATMSNADLVRKTFTGGKRSKDTSKQTRLQRADISSRPWRVRYTGADLSRLVPLVYADPSYVFHNAGTTLFVTTASGNVISDHFEVEVEVCVSSMLENNCRIYGDHFKPDGLLQLNSEGNFGLMSYSASQATEGGILRVPIGPIVKEFSSKSGTFTPQKGIINFINNFDHKGWSPLAEMYYEALRYLKGNEAGQSVYCGEGLVSEGKFPVYGCDSRKPWVDPFTSSLQHTSIIIVSDEYPSKDLNSVPGSYFNPTYVDQPMSFGMNAPYNPDVAGLTRLVGDAEGVTGTQQMVAVGNYRCRMETVTDLASVSGICPSEPQSEGTFNIAGLAYEAFTGDLRPDFEYRQIVQTFVLAYRGSQSTFNSPTELPMSPLMLAAKYGSFGDLNGNGLPDLQEEWADENRMDVNGNYLPFRFFYAEHGGELINSFWHVFLPIYK